MTILLGNLFKRVEAQEAKILAYLLCGELRPSYKKLTFNIADKQMFSALKEFFRQDSPDHFELEIKKSGDIGQAFSLVWQKNLNSDACTSEHCLLASKLTLLETYQTLENIALCSGNGSVQIKGQMILDLIGRLCPIGAKYTIKIILGKLRLGFSEMTILDALSWTIGQDKTLKTRLEKAFNVCADIGLIAQTLKSGEIYEIEKIQCTLGIPIRPAAAERMESIEEIVKKLEVFVAQPKLDGLRVQVHKYLENNDVCVKLFSRNLLDITEMFPELSLAIKKIPVKNFIAEGEAIGIDTKSGSFLPFQDTAKRLRKSGIEEASQNYPIKLFLFDLLLLDSLDLLNYPHHERRKLLEKLLNSAPERLTELEMIEEVQFPNKNPLECAQQLEEYFEKQLDVGLEGLVLKRPDGIYQAGKRNFNWIKLKRLESSQLNDSIDCVIMGYYFGNGKRANLGIGALLAGIYDQETETFQTICKIGTGLSDSDWTHYKNLCDGSKITTKPANFNVAKELEPDVWAQPSVVVSVRADQISRSPIHSAAKNETTQGFALRFPRLISLREDKSIFDATTSAELLKMYKNQKKI